MDVELTAEWLGGAAGVVVSLLLAYVPGLKDEFEKLSGVKKRAALGVALVLVSVAVYSLGCAGIVGMVACNQSGAVGVIRALVAALIASQVAYVVEGKSE